MPIGWLYGLSFALILAGAALAVSNSKRVIGVSERASVARQQAKIQGTIMFHIGAWTLVGTLLEMYVL